MRGNGQPTAEREASTPITPIRIWGWRLTAPGRLEGFEKTAERPGPNRVLVEIAGCGVCHTDLGFLFGGVATKHPLPLVLGHEIAGRVVAAGAGAESWLSRRVLVPAVAPCGTCRACRDGRATSCRASVMPGNDADGGFASHVEVSSRGLCPVDPGDVRKDSKDPVGTAGLDLWEISVVADAVTTPLQAIRRSGLSAGDLAVVIGAGGVGTYAVQIAKRMQASVAAVDLDPARLARARSMGADVTVRAGSELREIRGQLRTWAESLGAKDAVWRIYEMSGSKTGQELAFALLAPGATVSIVGYTPEPVPVRLSNLMAFDATAYGNWGCDPALYPEALALVASGDVLVRPLVKKEALADAPAVLAAVHAGQFTERVVLVP